MIGPDEKLTPEQVAAGIDDYLNSFTAHEKWKSKLALSALTVYPLFRLRPPFALMSPERRLAFIERCFISDVVERRLPGGIRRTVQSMLVAAQQLAIIGYYADPRTASSTGYVPFSKRKRYAKAMKKRAGRAGPSSTSTSRTRSTPSRSPPTSRSSAAVPPGPCSPTGWPSVAARWCCSRAASTSTRGTSPRTSACSSRGSSPTAACRCRSTPASRSSRASASAAARSSTTPSATTSRSGRCSAGTTPTAWTPASIPSGLAESFERLREWLPGLQPGRQQAPAGGRDEDGRGHRGARARRRGWRGRRQHQGLPRLRLLQHRLCLRQEALRAGQHPAPGAAGTSRERSGSSASAWRSTSRPGAGERPRSSAGSRTAGACGSPPTRWWCPAGRWPRACCSSAAAWAASSPGPGSPSTSARR